MRGLHIIRRWDKLRSNKLYHICVRGLFIFDIYSSSKKEADWNLKRLVKRMRARHLNESIFGDLTNS